jgi:two-component system cell cycle sensor histidine kinase/response regulator CckA
VVEDDRGVRSFAADVLTRSGFDVHAFSDGQAALAALPSLHPPPELLLTDIVMPGINGMVLASRVAAALPGIRVLYVSGYTQDIMVNHGVLKDSIDFLPKPYSADQLVRRVRAVLDRSESETLRVEGRRSQP